MKAIAGRSLIAFAILLTLAAAQCFAACSVKPCETRGAAHCHHQKPAPAQAKTCTSPLPYNVVSHDLAAAPAAAQVEYVVMVAAASAITFLNESAPPGSKVSGPLPLRV